MTQWGVESRVDIVLGRGRGMPEDRRRKSEDPEIERPERIMGESPFRWIVGELKVDT